MNANATGSLKRFFTNCPDLILESVMSLAGGQKIDPVDFWI
jgi:hypothetical protein